MPTGLVKPSICMPDDSLKTLRFCLALCQCELFTGVQAPVICSLFAPRSLAVYGSVSSDAFDVKTQVCIAHTIVNQRWECGAW